VTVTDGTFTANNNDVTSNLVTNTHIGDGIDLCSDSNTVTGNTVFSSAEAGIHLDSTCGSTGGSNTVNRNAVNEACAAILLGGSGNTLTANTYANVANTTLAGDVCTLAGVSAALVKSQVNSQGHSFRPARP
jgi:parallel beta-helix repeat protein